MPKFVNNKLFPSRQRCRKEWILGYCDVENLWSVFFHKYLIHSRQISKTKKWFIAGNVLKRNQFEDSLKPFQLASNKNDSKESVFTLLDSSRRSLIRSRQCCRKVQRWWFNYRQTKKTQLLFVVGNIVKKNLTCSMGMGFLLLLSATTLSRYHQDKNKAIQKILSISTHHFASPPCITPFIPY